MKPSRMLWLSAERARRDVAAAVADMTGPTYAVCDVARHAFGITDPDRSASTQIGKVMKGMGMRRIELRDQQPRYVYVWP